VSTFLHATVYMFLHNLLNVLVQIANKMGLQKKKLCSELTLESHTEHSFSVTLMCYKPCITNNSVALVRERTIPTDRPSLVHQFNTEQNNKANIINILKKCNAYWKSDINIIHQYSTKEKQI
jgi:hypothetical protein